MQQRSDVAAIPFPWQGIDTWQAGRRRWLGVLPSFGLSLGIRLLYLSLLVLIPLAALFIKTASLTPDQFWRTVTSPRALAAYRLSVGASLAGARLNVFGGLLVAWVLVRYRFPGRQLVDAL